MSQRSFFAGLALLTLLFGCIWANRHEPAGFGEIHDDTLYFSSAKALAEGRGYVIPQLPWEQAQTKYPVLYSWVLSWVWRFSPEFPKNLEAAYGLNAVFAACLLLASAALLRQLGSGRRETLALVGILAVHPHFVFWSDRLVSDVLFGALGLGACCFAYWSFVSRPKTVRYAAWAAAVGLLWPAVHTRSLGAAFVIGTCLAAARAGAWGRCLTAATALAPLGLSALAALSEDPSRGLGALPGFEQTRAYYTSYLEFWRLSVPDWNVFGAQLNVALTELCKHPAAAVFLLPATGAAPPLLQLCACAISAGVVAGIVRRSRRAGLHPTHYALLASLPAILIWNYPLLMRFLLPFLPLLLLGAAVELRRCGGLLQQSWRVGQGGSRSAAVLVAAAFGLLLGYAAYRYAWRVPRLFSEAGAARAAVVAANQDVYRWIRRNTNPDATILSYEDGALYLYTGRRGMQPLSFSTAPLFLQDKRRYWAEARYIADAAAALQADYWLLTPTDYSLAGGDEEGVRKRLALLLRGVPVAFESSGGARALYDIRGRGAELTRRARRFDLDTERTEVTDAEF